MRHIPQMVAVMTPFPHHVEANAPLATALAMMDEHDIRHLPVFENGDVVGVISERDLERAHIPGHPLRAETDLVVGDLCRRRPLFVDVGDPLDRVLLAMADKRLGSVLVLKEGELAVTEPAVRDIVRYYTREAGVRAMEREISKICRKAVKQLLTEKKSADGRPHRITVTPKNLDKFLGVRRYTFGIAEKQNQVGQVTGLAWTEVGGELLTIETVTMPGKGKTITTGKLGEVMQESIQAALSVVRNRSRKLGVQEDFYQKNDIHIHLPEGATPKDGPSAGVAMFLSLVSLLSGKPVRSDVAMTGEISLRGLVLPIGGVKEKTLAALRAGI